MKKDVFKEGYHGKQLSFYETLAAAAIAWVIVNTVSVRVIDLPQWYACGVLHYPGRLGNGYFMILVTVVDTLSDVVKTRLQVEARKGQSSYKGMGDAFSKICKWGLKFVDPASNLSASSQTRRRASRPFSREVLPVSCGAARSLASLCLHTSTCTRWDLLFCGLRLWLMHFVPVS
jgi:hypothetical protein